eukprot:TRINITY_DN112523_c0_g1_i1.p1 TRINITY_DN112523_c0_g1~~TRINITY_DN112523_c0_g1_i1.p1  ORF type:complete len:364 (-),score=79.41 TRINITY_DN112523_c0_g1_i1:13-1104(-)
MSILCSRRERRHSQAPARWLVAVAGFLLAVGATAHNSAVPASQRIRREGPAAQSAPEEPEEDKEPWTRFALLKRIQEAGVKDLTIPMPATFQRFLGRLWKNEVWQVHDGRFGKRTLSPEAQYSNVVCNKMSLKNVTLQAEGVFGESTVVSVNMDSQCSGDYCWQKMGWVSRGNFLAFSEGKLDVVFPPILPAMGVLGPFSDRWPDEVSENKGWCAPDPDDWRFDVEWAGKGPAGVFEEVLNRPHLQNTLPAAVCRSLRRRITLEDDDIKYFESPPFKCGRPWMPLVVLVVIVLLNIHCWMSAYNTQVEAFKAWQEAYVKSESAYHAKSEKKAKAKAKTKASAKPVATKASAKPVANAAGRPVA